MSWVKHDNTHKEWEYSELVRGLQWYMKFPEEEEDDEDKEEVQYKYNFQKEGLASDLKEHADGLLKEEADQWTTYDMHQDFFDQEIKLNVSVLPKEYQDPKEKQKEADSLKKAHEILLNAVFAERFEGRLDPKIKKLIEEKYYKQSMTHNTMMKAIKDAADNLNIDLKEYDKQTIFERRLKFGGRACTQEAVGKFVNNLATYKDHFKWIQGPTKDFNAWVQGGSNEAMKSHSEINCWEYILHAACLTEAKTKKNPYSKKEEAKSTEMLEPLITAEQLKDIYVQGSLIDQKVLVDITSKVLRFLCRQMRGSIVYPGNDGEILLRSGDVFIVGNGDHVGLVTSTALEDKDATIARTDLRECKITSLWTRPSFGKAQIDTVEKLSQMCRQPEKNVVMRYGPSI